MCNCGLLLSRYIQIYPVVFIYSQSVLPVLKLIGKFLYVVFLLFCIVASYFFVKHKSKDQILVCFCPWFLRIPVAFAACAYYSSFCRAWVARLKRRTAWCGTSSGCGSTRTSATVSRTRKRPRSATRSSLLQLTSLFRSSRCGDSIRNKATNR